MDWFYRRILRRSPPFGFCCDEHDLAYDEGGSWLADWRFARCLWAAGRKGKAVLLWAFVRGVRLASEVLDFGRVNGRAL